MVRALIISLVVCFNFAGYSTGVSPAYDHFATQPQLRVAFIGFVGRQDSKESAALGSTVAEALGLDQRLVLIDQGLIQLALKGIGYNGSINMSRNEARKLAAAIGCDLFIVGKAEALTRSAREKESHEEAYAGVMIVDARTGALERFDFISIKASTREAALRDLSKMLGERAVEYADQMIQVRSYAQQPLSKKHSPAGEIIEEIPNEESSRAAGFTAPEFLNRVKPDYSYEAQLSDITATVEAAAVFLSDGAVGAIEITRWAGFGLDESSVRAIRQLKFKPATRDGKPVSVRATIRYNFRRIDEPMSSKPEQPAAKSPDKPDRDLRQLFKPSYRRP